MNNCLNCSKELKHIEGRRKKKFCNNKCKGEYWRKQNGNNYKPKTKHLSALEYEKLLAQIETNNKPENKIKIEEERNTTHNLGEKHKNSQPSIDDAMKALYEATKAQIQSKNKK